MFTTENRRQDGAEHEAIALKFLEDLGYVLVKQNFTYGRIGEIDLIMRDGATWVFVEVKSRRSYRYGRPEDAVTPAKRRVIRRVAEGFIHAWKLTNVRARFDIVAVDYVCAVRGAPAIRHMIDAFP